LQTAFLEALVERMDSGGTQSDDSNRARGTADSHQRHFRAEHSELERATEPCAREAVLKTSGEHGGDLIGAVVLCGVPSPDTVTFLA